MRWREAKLDCGCMSETNELEDVRIIASKRCTQTAVLALDTVGHREAKKRIAQGKSRQRDERYA